MIKYKWKFRKKVGQRLAKYFISRESCIFLLLMLTNLCNYVSEFTINPHIIDGIFSNSESIMITLFTNQLCTVTYKNN